MNASIVIPTYWTDDAAKVRPRETVYDHPTELRGGVETLTRCLRSLTKIRGDFETIVIAVPTRMELAEKVEKRVGGIAADFEGSLHVRCVYPSTLRRVKRRFSSLGLEKLSRHLSFRGYGNVRNLCILIPYLLGLDAAILVDDDEIVTDRDFVLKPLRSLGGRWRGKPVRGVVGYYVYRGRGYRLVEPQTLGSLAWNKAKLMNESFKIIRSPRRLNPTNFAFGGCMAIHRGLIAEVPFDPWITRGEDIDYLLCSKAYGFKLPLDNQWSILHDPPPKKRGFWAEFEQDIYRFLYQREKLKVLEEKLNTHILEDIDPFPGYFLKEDLEGKILLTGILAGIEERGEKAVARESLSEMVKRFIKAGKLMRKPGRYAAKHAGRYLDFREGWREEMEKLGRHTPLKI